jgi:flavin-dependent dehydrogenase
LLVEAVPDGWWYSAPRPGGTLVAVYVTHVDSIARRHLGSLEGWRAKLGESLHTRKRVERHGGGESGSPATLPADTSRLERMAGRDWLAVGDAAFACDPLCSRGLMAAIAGGLEAARTARACLAGDDDATEIYAQGIAREYAAYLLNRKTYYALERRWPDAPFWRRRRSEVTVHLDSSHRSRIASPYLSRKVVLNRWPTYLRT